MKKPSRITEGGKVQMPETFIYTIGTGQLVDVYFGKNFDIAVVTAKDKNLSNDNKERIRQLTEV